MEGEMKEPKASPQHRLGGIALDVALCVSTCYIGWIIWSLVIWNKGLTPGKQILKLRVVSSVTGQTATWSHMAIRQLLIPLAFSLPFSLLQLVFYPESFRASVTDPNYYYYTILNSLGSLFLYLMSIGVSLVDGFWILKNGQNRRITDLWAKTDVLNTSAPSRQ